MQLSVIIVNYNVKYFLEHCLLSVTRACANIAAEIWVVDNLSTDGSVDLVTEKFPGVNLIANTENVGFARANNQAVAKAQGKYILYLNPDTIVPEDAFEKCLAYMDAHPEAGALGCRLVDGKGIFLPESKRGFPSAEVAFYRISGLSTLFKKSKRFNRYHLGHLPEHETHEVDVLVGCFMFCRKSVIDQVGSFDETYFMYGEDIDLSYKIIQAGFKNVYFPETTVIHYKGESTKKGSLNYVKMFYQAMIIFARKHFQSSQKSAFVMLIQMAIYLRAFLAFLANVFSKIKLPLIDAAILLSALLGMHHLWVSQVKTGIEYPTSLLAAFFSSYILIWILSVFFSGGYDTPYKPARVLRGMLIGGILSVAIYGLLPETLRFSRGITVLGALSGTLLMLAIRKWMQWMNIQTVEAEDAAQQEVMIVGSVSEEQEIRHLLDQAFIQKNIIGSISPHKECDAKQLGIFDDIKPLSQIYQVTEIIFAQQQLSFAQIISAIQLCGPELDYKIHSMGTDSIIGSNSKHTAGDLYTTEVLYQITTPASRRNKRVVDVLFSIGLILLSPVLIWFVKHQRTWLLHCFLVLEGDKTFVGYIDQQFPKIKPRLLDVYPVITDYAIPAINREHLDWLYAKNYNAWDDVRVIWNKWREI
ncbi:MAG: glycosyltransferase [Chitinophagaceae bacterium]|nr:glycosyltransferase [Chitinophagaceae bacterium]